MKHSVKLSLYYYLVRTYAKFFTTGKVLDSPLILQIQTQSFCNGGCSMCPYTTASKRLDQGMMEWKIFDKIAAEARVEKVLSAALFELHNEPLLDKRIFTWIKYFKSQNLNKSCGIVTNGELLDRYSMEEIERSDLDGLMISLNAHSKNVFEKVNTGLDYDRVRKNISSLLANKNLKDKVMLSFVAVKHNLTEIPQAIKYWESQGVKTRLISEITNRAGALPAFESLKPKTACRGVPFVSRLWQHLMNGAGRVTGCHLPFYQMNILFNGDVIICCHDWNRATVVGNIGSSSLREIWNSARMNELRKQLLSKKYEKIESCRECSLAHRAG